jgi:hypothetical protein
MTPTRRLALSLVAFALLISALPAGAFPGGGSRYDPGQRIEVTGLVTGPRGRPSEGLGGGLELARETVALRSFRKEKKTVPPVTAAPHARGEYSLAFPWDDYYHSFELVVGVTVRGRRGEELTVLERQDLTRRVEKGTPVVATVVVQNASFVENYRKFLATVDSDDERRVYDRNGRPDRVKVTNYPDRSETAWWYFEAGRVYRFVDGRLTATEEFAPVKEFDGGEN